MSVSSGMGLVKSGTEAIFKHELNDNACGRWSEGMNAAYCIVNIHRHWGRPISARPSSGVIRWVRINPKFTANYRPQRECWGWVPAFARKREGVPGWSLILRPNHGGGKCGDDGGACRPEEEWVEFNCPYAWKVYALIFRWGSLRILGCVVLSIETEGMGPRMREDKGIRGRV